MEKTQKRNSERAARVKKVADVMGVSPREVYLVLSGERNNDKILQVYMELLEGENELLESVRQLVPFL